MIPATKNIQTVCSSVRAHRKEGAFLFIALLALFFSSCSFFITKSEPCELSVRVLLPEDSGADGLYDCDLEDGSQVRIARRQSDMKSITMEIVSSGGDTYTFRPQAGETVSISDVREGTYVIWARCFDKGETVAAWNKFLSVNVDDGERKSVDVQLEWNAYDSGSLYTVSFYADEQICGKKSVRSGETVSLSDAPTVQGKSIVWFVDSLYKSPFFSNEAEMSEPIQYNMTVWGRTETATFTVTFETNGGSEVEPQSVLYGGYVSVPLPPAKDGYVFTGWYSDGELTKEYNFSTAVTASLTLYAGWDEVPPGTYTVMFDTDGGSAVSTQLVTEGSTAEKPESPEKAGYVFAGWYRDSELLEEYDFASPVTESITLYAKWEALPPGMCMVTFDTDGGSAVSSQTVTEGELAVRPEPPAKEGYDFRDWYLSATGDDSFDFATPITESITLFARYDAVAYTITYELDGGTNALENPASYTIEDSFALADPSNDDEDFAFVGWYEDSTFSGEKVTEIAQGSTGDKIFWAKWKRLANYYVSEAGDDPAGAGTRADPFATLARAVSEINTAGDLDAAATVYVTGKVTGTTNISSLSASELTICGTSGSGTDSLDGGQGGTVLSINTAVPVTIKNLKITGGKSASDGGGISVVGGTLTLESGTLISENECANNGGGVWNSNSTLLVKAGAQISGNTAAKNGGGIYNCSDSTLTLEGGKVSGNAAENGGGIYNNVISGLIGKVFIYGSTIIGDETATEAADSDSDKHSNSAKTGGGIYNVGSLYLGYSDESTKAGFSGGIFYNYTNGSGGGGVYSTGTLTMTGGTIGWNTANGASYDFGGGVCVAGGTFTMMGGSVTGNRMNTPGYAYGGGVGVERGSFVMGGKAVIGSIENANSENASAADADNHSNYVGGDSGSSKYGGGLYVGSGGTAYIGYKSANENDVDSDFKGGIGYNFSANAGGGISVGRGTLYLAGGTIARNGIGSQYGGGIFINSGTAKVVQSGGTIVNNSGQYGGGVNVGSGSYEMSGGSITKNTATQKGAGVYVQTGTNCSFTMSDGKITGNLGDGGNGVLITSGKFTMSGGTISGNAKQGIYQQYEGTLEISGSAKVSKNLGGGVQVDKGTFTMSGGEISGNTKSGNGAGVYLEADATMTMSGGALIKSDNDVYLPNGKAIDITDTLTVTGTVVTITPEKYESGAKVLSGTALGTEYGKFAVTQPSGDGGWLVDSDGKLKKEAGTLPIEIVLPSYGADDLAITYTAGEGSLTFSATSGYTGYAWDFDDGAAAGSGSSFTVDTANLAAGTYTVALEATKGGFLYSATAQVRVGVPASGGTMGGQSYDTKQALADAVRNLEPGSTATVALGSDTTTQDLAEIARALNNKDSCSVTLDLSACDSITEITASFPDIVFGASLANKQGLSAIIFPSSLTKIGNGAFANCQHLTSVTFPADSKLTEIGVGAFSQTSMLTSITFPSGLTKIGMTAFLNSGLTSATFSDTSHTWTIKGARGTNASYSVTNASTNATNIKTSSEYTGEWTRN